MKEIIKILIKLSDTKSVAFRQTSTNAALKMMTTLIEFHSKDHYPLGKRHEEIQKMKQQLFEEIIKRSFQDNQPKIRTICLKEIGHWMKYFPQSFLTDFYLKYLAEALDDEDINVCHESLKSLEPLYYSDERKYQLEKFKSKYKEKFLAAMGSHPSWESEVLEKVQKINSSMMLVDSNGFFLLDGFGRKLTMKELRFERTPAFKEWLSCMHQDVPIQGHENIETP